MRKLVASIVRAALLGGTGALSLWSQQPAARSIAGREVRRFATAGENGVTVSRTATAMAVGALGERIRLDPHRTITAIVAGPVGSP